MLGIRRNVNSSCKNRLRLASIYASTGWDIGFLFLELHYTAQVCTAVDFRLSRSSTQTAMKDLQMPPLPAPALLAIEASPRFENSISRMLTIRFIEHWKTSWVPVPRVALYGAGVYGCRFPAVPFVNSDSYERFANAPLPAPALLAIEASPRSRFHFPDAHHQVYRALENIAPRRKNYQTRSGARRRRLFWRPTALSQAELNGNRPTARAPM